MDQPDKRRFYHHLYFYVILAILTGIILGITSPGTAVNLKILSDVFIRLIRMIIAPLIFLTVTLGIASMQDLKKTGRVGLKSILYFEGITTLAMVIGLTVINLIRPGEGMNIDPSSLDTSSLSPEISNYTQAHSKEGLQNFIDKIIPKSIIDPFITGEILQVLFLALLTGFALASLKSLGKKIITILEDLSKIIFKIVSFLMYLAPIGALGAIAYTVGQFGTGPLVSLGKLMLCVYLTCFAFIFLILGLVAKLSGFSLLKFLRYIKNEILIVLGTSSSESVLPAMMQKMQKLGCSKSVSELVIPTGYSFNLDGTSIYLIMAAVFIAQATNTPLALEQQFLLLGVLMLTSKGAAAVTGGGLVTLAATIATMDSIPLAGITLLVGVDRFMSEARAVTNLIGNGVATVVISNWEKETDLACLKDELEKKPQ